MDQMSCFSYYLVVVAMPPTTHLYDNIVNPKQPILFNGDNSKSGHNYEQMMDPVQTLQNRSSYSNRPIW